MHDIAMKALSAVLPIGSEYTPLDTTAICDHNVLLPVHALSVLISASFPFRLVRVQPLSKL